MFAEDEAQLLRTAADTPAELDVLADRRIDGAPLETTTRRVVNAPYVPTDAIATLPPEARDHESRVALDGDADGLDVQRRVATQARAWLRPGGSLLIHLPATRRAARVGQPGADMIAGIGT